MRKELSIFVVENENFGGKARYYLVALVMYNQAEDVSQKIALYEESLQRFRSNLSFHFEQPLNGRGMYEGMALEARK